MYMAGRLRTASMPPSTLIESALYSPLPLLFAVFWFSSSVPTCRPFFSVSTAVEICLEDILLRSNSGSPTIAVVAGLSG